MSYELDHGPDVIMSPPKHLDYSLTGKDAARAIELGLAEADWYQTPIPRRELRKLLERKNGPAIRDTILWFGSLILSAWAVSVLWGTWWFVLPYLLYAVLYATASDSRWHECGHGTAFKSDWMNNLLYEISSFMVMRESVVWRWSHTRHHSDTIIVGRDPEIQVSRPPDIPTHVLSIFAIGVYRTYFPTLFLHASGKMSDAEKTFVPESEYTKVFRNARILLVIYAVIIGLAIFFQSWLPLLFFVFPHFFGTWLMIVHNTTQHAGLAENVLDHRLNCRTVYMNPFSRFVYWNMNYHVEHHMFPLVPYHRLPELHKLVKDDCPPPYGSIAQAWKEILSATIRQIKEPSWYVKRTLPDPRPRQEEARFRSNTEPDQVGWVEVCSVEHLGKADVIRFDHGKKTYAVYCDADGNFYATDGVCTHGNTHLVDGLIVGNQIECPKHNGRFFLQDGAPARAPICRGLATYPVEIVNDKIRINILEAGGVGAREQKTYDLRVVSNRSVSTFIKELILEPIDPSEKIQFTPGDYLQIDIPTYDEIKFSDFEIPEPYASVWRDKHIFDYVVSNGDIGRRNNYSLACNAELENTLMFNVRIATPPPGQDCPPGVGSAYMFSLKPGDTISAIGPFGDFHMRPTQKEMVYIGGGSGMAPLRAHISYLLETEKTARKVSFWYGARSKQEIFYDDYFTGLANTHSNFSFHVALSSPLPEDQWDGLGGFIHQVVMDNYLSEHPNISSLEFYLCGPPQMIKACKKMLTELGVSDAQIMNDEF